MSAKAQAINMPQTADVDASERGTGKIELLMLHCLGEPLRIGGDLEGDYR